ncbi:MAG: TolC family protein, partial [Acetobacteraceae bacterium]
MRLMSHPRRLSALAAALALCVGGCSVGADYKRPALDIPAQFRATPASAHAAWPTQDWWRGFRSAELDQLIAAAETGNFDIAAAIARVRQADAAVRVAGASLLPALNATAGASMTQEGVSSRNLGAGVQRGGSGAVTLHGYSVGLDVAYQTDFWGHIRSQRNA